MMNVRYLSHDLNISPKKDISDVLHLLIVLTPCRDPTVGPKSLALLLSTLFGKKGIFTRSLDIGICLEREKERVN